MASSPLFKIDSPYAKFGLGGQISCTLCNCPVKSAKVWIAHVNGRQHRENLSSKGSKKQPQQAQKPPTAKPDVVGQKRPASNERSNGHPAGTVIKKAKPTPTGPSVHPSASTASDPPPVKLVPQFGDDDESESSADEDAPTRSEAPASGLPTDFFDVSTSSTTDKTSQQPAAIVTEAPPGPKVGTQKGSDLPEGFFDDRKKDAKARGVELKDPLDDEWSKFQKEMQKVEAASEQIVEEDEDQMTVERELDEAEEQMREWSRINELEKKKDTLLQPEVPADEARSDASLAQEGTDDELDNVTIENVLDWRSKEVWR